MKKNWVKVVRVGVFAICLVGLSLASFAQKPKKEKDKAKEKNKNTAENVFAPSGEQSKSESEYYLVEAMKFYIIDDYEKALEHFQKALVLSSGSAAIHYKLGETYYKLKNYPQAASHAQEALNLDKTNKYYYILLASVQLAQQKPDDAVRTYQSLIDSKVGNPEYYYEIAQIHLRQENFGKAIDALDKLEVAWGLNENVSLQKQKIYYQNKQFDKAIAEGQKLVQAFPEEPRYVITLAELLIANNRSSEALTMLETAAGNQSYDPRVYLLLAQLYRNQGNFDKSISYLKIAFQNPELAIEDKINWLAGMLQSNEAGSRTDNLIELAQSIAKTHPENAKAYIVLADALLLTDDKPRVLANYLEAVRRDNSQAEVWQRILALEADMRQLDSLTKHAEQALEIFPNQALFWMYNGLGWLGKRNYSKAVESFEEGKRLAFNNTNLLNDFNTRLGDSYNGLKQYPESDAAYEAVLKNDPNNAIVLNNYSYFLALRKEKLDLAKQLAERLVSLHPENPTFLDTYGWVLYIAKDYKKSRKYLEKAVQSTTAGGTIIEHYGDVLYQLGEEQSAIEQWQKAKKLGGTTQLIDKKIADKKLYE
ncbi:MAG: tetratricopeptide repeat protein [Microscillaceae bacterium]|jgi:tetratricopeptide (TPR) repeat protein|nr:tetratricopeptide repeat protein [Microscillaceae bacterium]